MREFYAHRLWFDLKRAELEQAAGENRASQRAEFIKSTCDDI